jgi:hypothetical protein
VKKRLLLLFALLAVLGMVGFGVYLWWTLPSHGVHLANVYRIQVGMSEHAVSEILGHPSAEKGNVRSWQADTGTIVVTFDAQGKVSERYYVPRDESLLNKFFAWLGIS